MPPPPPRRAKPSSAQCAAAGPARSRAECCCTLVDILVTRSCYADPPGYDAAAGVVAMIVGKPLGAEEPAECDYVILHSDALSRQVHLDGPLDCRGFCTWALEGTRVEISEVQAFQCTIPLSFRWNLGMSLSSHSFSRSQSTFWPSSSKPCGSPGGANVAAWPIAIRLLFSALCKLRFRLGPASINAPQRLHGPRCSASSQGQSEVRAGGHGTIS